MQSNESIMDVLEKLLYDLQASIDNGESILSCSDIADNICHHCIYNLTLFGTELDYTLFYLTQSVSPPNILEFLTIRTKDKEIVKAKVVLFKFLVKLIKVVGSAMESYCLTIFTTCIDIFKKDDSNEVKANALGPVKKLLNLTDYQLSEAEVNLESLYTLLISQYGSKKSTAGMRYNILVTLGLLVHNFPCVTETLSRVDRIADISFAVLNTNFGSKAKSAPDLSTIAGAFSCIDR